MQWQRTVRVHLGRGCSEGAAGPLFCAFPLGGRVARVHQGLARLDAGRLVRRHSLHLARHLLLWIVANKSSSSSTASTHRGFVIQFYLTHATTTILTIYLPGSSLMVNARSHLFCAHSTGSERQPRAAWVRRRARAPLRCGGLSVCRAPGRCAAPTCG